MSAPSPTLLQLSGKDAPGITSEVMRLLDEAQAEILDLHQTVIHGSLRMSLLVRVTDGAGLLKKLEKKAGALGLKLHHETLPATATGSARQTWVATMIGSPIPPRALQGVSQAFAQSGFNIDTIQRLSEPDFHCVELQLSTARDISESEERQLKASLLSLGRTLGIDIALQKEGLYRRAKLLVAFDMDSTLIQNEVIDELARQAGKYDEVAAITHRAMSGGLDYDESLRLRCEMLQGLGRADLEAVLARVQLTPGAEELVRILKKLGFKVALISGGFTFVADRMRERLGIDFAYANTLETRDGKLTGKVLPPIVNAQRKADLLEVIAQQERISLEQVIAIGDGANDLLMLERAGLGIAFNAKPALRDKADFSLNQTNLRSVLYLLGLSAAEIADA
jgi:phosphoserine phosphatase